MLELKVILANLIRQFHFFVDPSAPEVIPLQETTLNPKTPVNLIVSKRLSAY
jgi:cytochrome P450